MVLLHPLFFRRPVPFPKGMEMLAWAISDSDDGTMDSWPISPVYVRTVKDPIDQHVIDLENMIFDLKLGKANKAFRIQLPGLLLERGWLMRGEAVYLHIDQTGLSIWRPDLLDHVIPKIAQEIANS